MDSSMLPGLSFGSGMGGGYAASSRLIYWGSSAAGLHGTGVLFVSTCLVFFRSEASIYGRKQKQKKEYVIANLDVNT